MFKKHRAKLKNNAPFEPKSSENMEQGGGFAPLVISVTSVTVNILQLCVMEL